MFKAPSPFKIIAAGLFIGEPADQSTLTAAALKLGPRQDNSGPAFAPALLCGSPADGRRRPVPLSCAPPTGQSASGTAYQTNLVAAGGLPTTAPVDFTAVFVVSFH